MKWITGLPCANGFYCVGYFDSLQEAVFNALTPDYFVALVEAEDKLPRYATDALMLYFPHFTGWYDSPLYSMRVFH